MVQIQNTDIEGRCDDVVVDLVSTSPDFRSWLEITLAQRLGTSFPQSFSRCEKSPGRSHTRGQTDIGIFYKDKRGSLVLLIENKVMSPFTPDQVSRYLEEVKALTHDNQKAYAILMCPARYAEKASGAKRLHAHVSYEEILKETGGNRELEDAVERCRTGWVAEEIPEVTHIFEVCFSLIATSFPSLKMKTKPSNKPTQSRTIYFDEKHAGICGSEWPSAILNYQLQEGRVKVLFRGWGRHRDKLEPIITKDLRGTPYAVDPNRTGSFGIMKNVPPVDNHGNAMEQSDKMRQGLEAAAELHSFIRKNLSLVKGWEGITEE